MKTLIVGVNLLVQTSAPPLSPAEAVAVLRAHHSLLDRTDARSGDGPTFVVIRSSPGSGPFGPFPAPPPAPPAPVIRFHIPHKGGR